MQGSLEVTLEISNLKTPKLLRIWAKTTFFAFACLCLFISALNEIILLSQSLSEAFELENNFTYLHKCVFPKDQT